MSVNWMSQSHQSIQSLVPYQPGKPIETLQRELNLKNKIIKLASNENPLGPSEKSIAALCELANKNHRYPDADCFQLKQAIAERHNLKTNQLTFGNGSDELFRLIANAFTGPNDAIAYWQYCFATYPIATAAAQATPQVIPCPNHQFDLASYLDTINDKTKVVFLANPNNPTGTCFTHQQVKTLLDNTPKHILFVLDEAYAEYMTPELFPEYPNSIALLQQYDNLIVTRTFSKLHALGGLRIGYGLSNSSIADILNRIRLPFNVNLAAQTAALAALGDTAHQQRSLESNLHGIEQLKTGLFALGLKHLSPAGNFITIDCGSQSMTYYNELQKKGIIVRPLINYNLDNYLRITVGLKSENERLLEELSNLL